MQYTHFHLLQQQNSRQTLSHKYFFELNTIHFALPRGSRMTDNFAITLARPGPPVTSISIKPSLL